MWIELKYIFFVEGFFEQKLFLRIDSVVRCCLLKDMNKNLRPIFFFHTSLLKFSHHHVKIKPLFSKYKTEYSQLRTENSNTKAKEKSQMGKSSEKMFYEYSFCQTLIDRISCPVVAQSNSQIQIFTFFGKTPSPQLMTSSTIHVTNAYIYKCVSNCVYELWSSLSSRHRNVCACGCVREREREKNLYVAYYISCY